MKLNVVCVDIANITGRNVNHLCAGCHGDGIAVEGRLLWKCPKDFSSLLIKVDEKRVILKVDENRVILEDVVREMKQFSRENY